MSALTRRLQDFADSDVTPDPLVDALLDAIEELESLQNRLTDTEAALKFTEIKMEEYKRALAEKI